MCETWGCMLDELLERNTYGQLLLMAVGSKLNADKMMYDLERERRAQGRVLDSHGRPVQHTKITPPKKVSEMTLQEYQAYMAGSGMGGGETIG